MHMVVPIEFRGLTLSTFDERETSFADPDGLYP